MDSQLNQSKTSGLTLWIIWGFLTSSVFTYFVVLQFIGSEKEVAIFPDEMMVKILTGVAVLNLLISFGIRKMVTLPLSEKLEPKNFQKLMASCIISWALAESVAIFGLILGLMGAPMSTCGLFFLAGFGAMVFQSPSFIPLKGLIRRLPDQ